jgi:hypothetical protein
MKPRHNYFKKFYFVFFITTLSIIKIQLNCADEEIGKKLEEGEIIKVSAKVTDSEGIGINEALIITLLDTSTLSTTDSDGRNDVQFVRTDSEGNFTLNLPTKDTETGALVDSYKIFIYKSGFEKYSSIIYLNDINIDYIILEPWINSTGINICLFDPEPGRRGTDFLHLKKVDYFDLKEQIPTDLSYCDTLFVGWDTSKYSPYKAELVENIEIVLNWVKAGGNLVFGQQNDFGFIGGMFSDSGVSGTENLFISYYLENDVGPYSAGKPSNDVETGTREDETHLIVSDISDYDLEGWEYIQPAKEEIDNILAWDVFVSSGTNEYSPDIPDIGSDWNIIIGCVKAGSDEMDDRWKNTGANKCAIAIEAYVGGGKIFLNQASYYQGSANTENSNPKATNPIAIIMSDNMVNYLK